MLDLGYEMIADSITSDHHHYCSPTEALRTAGNFPCRGDTDTGGWEVVKVT